MIADFPQQIEEELKKSLKEWEKDNETFFLYNGARYLDRIVSQHEAWEALKEEKKQERVRQSDQVIYLITSAAINPVLKFR